MAGRPEGCDIRQQADHGELKPRSGQRLDSVWKKKNTQTSFKRRSPDTKAGPPDFGRSNPRAHRGSGWRARRAASYKRNLARSAEPERRNLQRLLQLGFFFPSCHALEVERVFDIFGDHLHGRTLPSTARRSMSAGGGPCRPDLSKCDPAIDQRFAFSFLRRAIRGTVPPVAVRRWADRAGPGQPIEDEIRGPALQARRMWKVPTTTPRN